MSVLIKDIKMPKCCVDCPCFYDFISCQALLDGTDDFYVSGFDGYKMRLPNCPLVEVPAPHGRLIDIETLKDDMAVLLERNGKLIDEWLAYRVEDTIDDQATIIEAEEGRG